MKKTTTNTEHAFWDASAIVLLAVDQPGTQAARAARRTTKSMVVWWGTRLEATSAIARLVREGLVPQDRVAAVERKIDAILGAAIEVVPSDAIRDHACELVRQHPLRAGDALQLAAALEVCRGRPRGRVLVVLDRRLRDVAGKVGFDVRP